MDIVLNWLWQGGIVALAAAALLYVLPQLPGAARYRIVWAACIALVALPWVPLVLASGAPAQLQSSRALTTSGFAVPVPHAWWTSNTFAVCLWSVWAMACVGRFVAASRARARMRRECRPMPRALETHLRHWSRAKSTGRESRLMLSTRVRSAAVLGGGPPVIAVAPALVENLSADDLDRVVMHEWAHVQRRDDVAQYFQAAVTTFAGWHPGMWWLLRRLALEREVACDEAAVAATGSAKAYAACLTAVAGLAVRNGPSSALAVSSSGLARRVIRVLNSRQERLASPARGLAAAGALAVTALVLAVGGVRFVITASTPAIIGAAQVIAGTPGPRIELPALVPPGVETSGRSTPTRPPASSRQRTNPPANRSNSLPLVVPRDVASGVDIPAPTAIASAPSEEPETVIGVVPAATVEPFDTADVAISAPAPATEPAIDTSEDGARTPTPWIAAADAGAAIGRRSQAAGVSTAAFFNRFGRKIAASF